MVINLMSGGNTPLIIARLVHKVVSLMERKCLTWIGGLRSFVGKYFDI